MPSPRDRARPRSYVKLLSSMLDAGRYRALRRIGRGGMAEVLEGVALGENGFERRIAIKRMLPESAGDDSFARMFLEEARIASRLHHANIVGILDYGLADGLPFQVLEFIDGMDAQKLRDKFGTLPIELALYICTEIGHALAHAHAALDAQGSLGIVHRDVKPSNIIISWHGDVKLTDFGIAFARDREIKTVAGETKGTPLYMAPEQFSHGGLDARTDVFALGCVLQTLCSGWSPLRGDQLAHVLSGRDVEPDPGLPADVRAIIARATRHKKEARYASADELTQKLGSALAERMSRDAKTAMREFMQSARGAGQDAKPRGRFDDVVALDLFATDRGKDLFETRPAPLATAATVVPAKPHRARAWRVAAALAGGLALAGVGVSLARRAAHHAPLPEPPRPAPAPRVAGPEPSPPSMAPTEPHPQAANEPQAPPEREAVARRRAPAPKAMAVLAIGGESIVSAEIIVDGRDRGYTPKVLELPVGKHRVELITRDGRRIGPALVTLTARNTARSPLRYSPRGDR